MNEEAMKKRQQAAAFAVAQHAWMDGWMDGRATPELRSEI